MKSITFTFAIPVLHKLNCKWLNEEDKTFKLWCVARSVSTSAYQYVPKPRLAV